MNEDLKNPARSPREDAALIRAFQGGDKAAFDELVLKHHLSQVILLLSVLVLHPHTLVSVVAIS